MNIDDKIYGDILTVLINMMEDQNNDLFGLTPETFNLVESLYKHFNSKGESLIDKQRELNYTLSFLDDISNSLIKGTLLRDSCLYLRAKDFERVLDIASDYLTIPKYGSGEIFYYGDLMVKNKTYPLTELDANIKARIDGELE